MVGSSSGCVLPLGTHFESVLLAHRDLPQIGSCDAAVFLTTTLVALDVDRPLVLETVYFVRVFAAIPYGARHDLVAGSEVPTLFGTQFIGFEQPTASHLCHCGHLLVEMNVTSGAPDFNYCRRLAHETKAIEPQLITELIPVPISIQIRSVGEIIIDLEKANAGRPFEIPGSSPKSNSTKSAATQHIKVDPFLDISADAVPIGAMHRLGVGLVAIPRERSFVVVVDGLEEPVDEKFQRAQIRSWAACEN